MNELELLDKLVENSSVDREFSKIAAGMSPEALAAIKDSLIGGLSGSLMGGTTMGLYGALSPKDDDEDRMENVKRKAGLGAVMGGVAGAAIPAALNLMPKGDRSPGFNFGSPFNLAGDSAISLATATPGATAGAVLAAYINAHLDPQKNKPGLRGRFRSTIFRPVLDTPAPETVAPAIKAKPEFFSEIPSVSPVASSSKSISERLGNLIRRHIPNSVAGPVRTAISKIPASVSNPVGKVLGKIPYMMPKSPAGFKLSRGKLAFIAALAAAGYSVQKSITQGSGD